MTNDINETLIQIIIVFSLLMFQVHPSVNHKKDWDEIVHDFELYTDDGPLLQIRKVMVLVYASLSLFCQIII